MRHVLQAVPIYYISLIEPPKLTLRDISRLIADFFQHVPHPDGYFKCYWVNFRQTCRPCIKERLGLRDASDIAKAFAMKLQWRFRGNDSLWAHCMHAKYCQNQHESQVSLSQSASHIWRRMLQVRDIMEQNIT